MKNILRIKTKVLAILLTLAMMIGMLPVSVLAANTQPTKKELSANVVVSVEGQTLGHGFYIEPTIVTFDEFIQYWADKGTTVTPAEITAGGMINYVLYTRGLSVNHHGQETVTGPGYLSGIDGVKAGKGDAVVPDCLTDDGITLNTQVAGDDLYEKAYTSGSGWMYTEGNWMSNQSMASHRFSVYGTPYTAHNGQAYYVVRLQYTIAGLGADLGFNRYGTDYGYTAADKSQLYILYALLAERGFFETNQAAKENALKVMNALDASQEEVDAAYENLLRAGQAQTPDFTIDLTGNPIHYPTIGAEASPLAIEASVSEGELRYQWYQSADRFSWDMIESATQESYTPQVSENGTSYYKCVVTNEDGNKLPCTIESTIATVVVGTKPNTPMIWPDLDSQKTYSLYASNPVPLSVSAMVYPSDGGTISYQWYEGMEGASSIDQMDAIPDATGNSYTPDVNTEGVTVYGCRITNTKDGNKAIADSTLCTVTVANNTILIYTEDELRSFLTRDLSGSYKLANDIELTGNWTEIEGFAGTLDGDGHTIYGLNVDSNSFSYGGGLFAYTMAGATIKNLGLVGKVHQNQANVNVAALVGAIYGDTSISNCYVNVEVSGNGSNYRAGGIVADATSTGKIENCYFVGSIDNVHSAATVGGVIANRGSVEIRNCYTTCEIAIGNYGSTDDADTWNNYCASIKDAYADQIPEDMQEFLTALNNGGSAFSADIENINNGLPILSWQAEPVTPPADLKLNLEKHLSTLLGSVPNPIVGSTGGEWVVLTLARAGYEVPDGYYSNYYAKVVQALINGDGALPDSQSKSTEYSRVILALTAIGMDITDVNGYNLLTYLTDMDYVTAQGINGPIWALIAFDSHDYEIPRASENTEQVTRKKLIAYILERQFPDGGWALNGNAADPDMTGMALQALAPYYATDPAVKTAVDKALECLSNMQLENGGFASGGIENSESNVQVIVALTALGIDPTKDVRFVKANGNPVSALLTFALEDGGFKHTLDESELNGMATEQGTYALTAYDRFLNDETSLYDMSDVKIDTNPDVPVPEDKDMTLTDVNETGITVTGKESILNGWELEAKLLTSGELYDKVKEALKNGKFTLYDLYLLENNLEVQPDGTITTAIPVPDGYDGAQCKVYRVNADGSVTEVTAVLKDGKLTFKTDEVGAFAVYQPVKVDTDEPGVEEPTKPGVDEPTTPGDNDGTTESPKTGDSTPVALMLTVTLCSLAALVVLGKKKKTVK